MKRLLQSRIISLIQSVIVLSTLSPAEFLINFEFLSFFLIINSQNFLVVFSLKYRSKFILVYLKFFSLYFIHDLIFLQNYFVNNGEISYRKNTVKNVHKF